MKPKPIERAQIDMFHECLELDRATGRVFWKVKIAKKVVVGSEAGGKNNLGYRRVNLFGAPYLTHRIVFAMVHGYCPDEVDHINGDPSDNRPENLRPATRSQQNMNRAKQNNNTSGHKGVYWFKPGKYWASRIKVGGRYVCLGYFRDIEQAAAAYQAGAEKYHGEYQRGVA